MTPRRLLLPLLLCLLLVAIPQAPAAGAPLVPPPSERATATVQANPQPFAARYRLEVSGWPSTSIDHRLTRDGASWFSEMRAAIAVARGAERSRFLVEEEGVRSLQYTSGYSLLGFGGDYRLAPDDLASLPDRQAALFELSRRAVNGSCSGECELRYQDHRGREEQMNYRVVGAETLSLPSGRFEAVAVKVNEPGKPERHLVFHFHPELPGLLLAAEFHRDGERRSRLSLTHLTLDD
ncbi:hypothetical protein [Halomonas mongoliensis]|uniref:hypothetical protein n=1 Tax=Halomonas mongoliensis TaxID=321265 RepID=UPI00403AA4EF